MMFDYLSKHQSEQRADISLTDQAIASRVLKGFRQGRINRPRGKSCGFCCASQWIAGSRCGLINARLAKQLACF